MSERNIEEELASLERAQVEYRREQFRERFVKLAADPGPGGEIDLGELQVEVKSRLNLGAPGDEVFGNLVEKIAGDTDLESHDIERAYKRLVGEAKQMLTDTVEDVRQISDEVRTKLSAEADPWVNKPGADAELTRALQEMTLRGGPPGDRRGVLAAAEAAAAGHDRGELMLWSRNFDRLFDRATAPEDGWSSIDEARRLAVLERIEQAVDKHRSYTAQRAAKKLQMFEEWIAKIDLQMRGAEMRAADGAEATFLGLANRHPLRRRTQEERELAKLKRKMRQLENAS